MKKSTKGILTAIPLVVGLAGTAAAGMADAAPAENQNAAGVIDSLLNQYSGLLPGEGGQAGTSAQISPSQHVASFGDATGTMGSYYTPLGGERTVSPADQPVRRSSEEAAAPTGLTVVARIAPDTLGAVASGISPSSTGSTSQPTIVAAGEAPAGDPITTTIIPTDTNPVPVPAAAVLLGSGLAALAAGRRRKDHEPEAA